MKPLRAVKKKRTKKVFLGYCVFYNKTPFPCSGNTVTRDKVYLRAHALFKINKLDRACLDDFSGWQVFINRTWELEQAVRPLTLRRVYAIVPDA